MAIRTRTLLLLAAIALTVGSLIALSGCGTVTNALGGDQGEGKQAVDSVELTSTESALMVTALDAIDPLSSIEQMANDIGVAATNQFTPADCVIAGAEGSVVTYQLNGCTGPYGLQNVSGTALITLNAGTDSVEATLTATDLQANNGTMTINATSSFSTAGTEKSMQVSTTGAGTGANGEFIARTGTYDVTWDNTTECMNLDGTWTSTVNDDEAWVTTVSDYQRCGAACPADGGTILYAGSDGTVVNVEFDGTNSATILSTTSLLATVPLSCNP